MLIGVGLLQIICPSRQLRQEYWTAERAVRPTNERVSKCTLAAGSASCQDAGAVDIYVEAYSDTGDVDAKTEVRSGLCEVALHKGQIFSGALALIFQRYS